MELLLFLAVIMLLLAWYSVAISHQSTKQIREELSKLNETLSTAVLEFDSFLTNGGYFNHKKLERWRERYAHIYKTLTSYRKTQYPKENIGVINIFLDCYLKGEAIRDSRNKTFVEEKKIQHKSLFDSLESYPLDDQQRTAILHDEDNTLVIAGAGTGKTSTIVGKTAYIIESNQASEDEILLITFTKNAAQEMEERIETRVGKKVDVKTFNAFGYHVIGEVEGGKPDLISDGRDGDSKSKELIINLLKKISQEGKFKATLARFFLYYLFPQPKTRTFDTLDEYYTFVKSIGLITFKGELVKSFQELKIANFLYLHDIKYEYEFSFDAKLKTVGYKQYKPDFYLPDYSITIEHFGVDRKGNVPKFFKGDAEKSAKERYQQKIKYARSIHLQYGRTLIETYSYEDDEDTLLDNLRDKLERNGVVLNERPLDEVLAHIQIGKTFGSFIDLLFTFLTLFKSNHANTESLEKKVSGTKDKRIKTFTQIFVSLYDAYEAHLKEQGKIDFNDMVIRATQYISEGKYAKRYKYILVDEFQDMSVGRYRLLKALREQNEDTKMFCVGDDWQSIFRFTGSDLTITTLFDEYFGFTYHAKLEHTHRFNNKILDYSSTFIQSNPNQIKKSLVSDVVVPTTFSALSIVPYENENESEAALMKVLGEVALKFFVGKKLRVLVIGRYNRSKPKNFETISRMYSNSLDIAFLTAHKAKGTTFDFSVLIDVNAGMYGFPSEMIDDPLLQLVLHKGDGYENAEERRLFYVALTRAKDANFLTTQKGAESKFIKELQKSARPENISEIEPRCPVCSGLLTKRAGSYGSFLGCSNYPLCNYTKKV